MTDSKLEATPPLDAESGKVPLSGGSPVKITKKPKKKHVKKRGMASVDRVDSVEESTETSTPLLGDNLQKAAARASVGLIDAASKASESLEKGQQFLISQYVAGKEMTRKSPWIVSILIIVASFGVIWSGVFSSLWDALTFSPVNVALKFYQVIFGAVVLFLEVSRYFDPFNLQRVVKNWCKFLDTTLGRGLLQMLPGTLACVGWDNVGEWVPGLVLLVTGFVNIFYGIYNAWKMRKIMREMKRLESESEERRNSPSEFSQIDLMARKFQAIDITGNGKLAKNDLMQACKEMNIELSDGDAEMVFAALDRKDKGFIDVKDFENWWFKSKAAGLFV